MGDIDYKAKYGGCQNLKAPEQLHEHAGRISEE